MTGIYRKYNVERTDGDPTAKHEYCDYFVLDFNHDPFALAATYAYATACEKREPQLAKDLRNRAKLAGGVNPALLPCPMCEVRAKVNAAMSKQLDEARREHECSHGTSCRGQVTEHAAPYAHDCPSCVAGFPVSDGMHYGTQRHGMIPTTPCATTDGIATGLSRALEALEPRRKLWPEGTMLNHEVGECARLIRSLLEALVDQ